MNSDITKAQLNKLSRVLGVELVNSNNELSFTGSGEQAYIRKCLDEHGVILFRNQDFHPHNLMKEFGFLGQFVIEQHDVDNGLTLPGCPECFIVKYDKDNPPVTLWHCDKASWSDPVTYSLLYCKKCPALEGSTLISNTRLAFKGFSPPMQKILRGMQAVYNEKVASLHNKNVVRMYKNRGFERFDVFESLQDCSHPLIQKNPRNHAESIYFSPIYFSQMLGMDEQESNLFKDLLIQKISSQEYTYRHQWQEGDLMIIDNRSTCHRGIADLYSDEKILYRLIQV